MNTIKKRGKILLIEDDRSLIKGLQYTLEKEGFSVYTALTAEDGFSLFREEDFKLILLDVNLPDGNGFDLCREIRKITNTPIIFLTACDEEINVIMGLDLGGDDYLCKPFRVNELISRINAVFRRSNWAEKDQNTLDWKNISLDRESFRVLKDGCDLYLTSTEYRLVNVLLSNRGNTITRDRLIDLLWDRDEHFVDSNTLSVYIRRLRKKMEDDPGNPEYIETVRGIGYRWR